MLSDLNGDGQPDIGVGDPWSSGSGRLFVLCGVTSQTILVVEGKETEVVFGAAIAPIGDVNGDGVDDIAVSFLYAASELGGGVRIISGVDGERLYAIDEDDLWALTYDFPAGKLIGDLNGDRIVDISDLILFISLMEE